MAKKQIPYAPGRDKTTQQTIDRLNAGDTIRATTPRLTAILSKVQADYPTKMEAVIQLPAVPDEFDAYENDDV